MLLLSKGLIRATAAKVNVSLPTIACGGEQT